MFRSILLKIGLLLAILALSGCGGAVQQAANQAVISQPSAGSTAAAAVATDKPAPPAPAQTNPPAAPAATSDPNLGVINIPYAVWVANSTCFTQYRGQIQLLDQMGTVKYTASPFNTPGECSTGFKFQLSADAMQTLFLDYAVVDMTYRLERPFADSLAQADLHPLGQANYPEITGLEPPMHVLNPDRFWSQCKIEPGGKMLLLSGQLGGKELYQYVPSVEPAAQGECTEGTVVRQDDEKVRLPLL